MATATYNGKAYTRNTARTYTHAVACTVAELKPWHKGEPDGIVAWCGSRELAEKAAKKFRAPNYEFARVEVVEVSA